MNKKVYVCTERDDYLIGTVSQVVEERSALGSLQEALAEIVQEMVDDECFDDDSIEFTIQIR